jgi:hypothetical protein
MALFNISLESIMIRTSREIVEKHRHSFNFERSPIIRAIPNQTIEKEDLTASITDDYINIEKVHQNSGLYVIELNKGTGEILAYFQPISGGVYSRFTMAKILSEIII